MALMTHAKFHFNWLMLTSIFGIWASEPPWAWRTTEKAGPDRVKLCQVARRKVSMSRIILISRIFHLSFETSNVRALHIVQFEKFEQNKS